MTFKVGDKVRCIVGSGNVLKQGEIYTVFGVDGIYIDIDKNSDDDGWWIHRFELVEQPEPQVGDVLKSENGEVVRVLSIFENGEGRTNIGFIALNGTAKGRAVTVMASEFERVYVILLHRPPKKQPKPKVEQPKKQEEVWERIFQSNEDYRCGNKIKVIYQGYEGLAVCNKHDKFDLMFGVNLAAHRAMVKYHQNVIDEMLKEGAK